MTQIKLAQFQPGLEENKSFALDHDGNPVTEVDCGDIVHIFSATTSSVGCRDLFPDGTQVVLATRNNGTIYTSEGPESLISRLWGAGAKLTIRVLLSDLGAHSARGTIVALITKQEAEGLKVSR